MVSGCKSRKIFRSYGTLFCIISTKGTYVPSCNISSLRDFVVEKFYFISDGVKVRSSGVEVRSGEVETIRVMHFSTSLKMTLATSLKMTRELTFWATPAYPSIQVLSN